MTGFYGSMSSFGDDFVAFLQAQHHDHANGGWDIEECLSERLPELELPRMTHKGVDHSFACAQLLYSFCAESDARPPARGLHRGSDELRGDRARYWYFASSRVEEAPHGYASVLRVRPDWRVELSAEQAQFLQDWEPVWNHVRSPGLLSQRRALRRAWLEGVPVMLLHGANVRTARALVRYLHVRYASHRVLRPLGPQLSSLGGEGALLYLENPQHDAPEQARALVQLVERRIRHLPPQLPDAPIRAPERRAERRPRPAGVGGQAARDALEAIVGESPALTEALHQVVHHAREMANATAQADRVLLLTGPSGVGKELFALLVAALVHRPGRTVELNAATIQPTLAASTLFGIGKGVASEVEPSEGAFGEAKQGVLYLDELGHLPREVAPLLLRAIEPGTYSRVGRPKEVLQSDVVLVLAGDESLLSALEAGTFPKAFLNRLRARHVEIPSLFERRSDLRLLAERFLRPERCSDELVEALQSYPWPGNVRELRQVMLAARSEMERCRDGRLLLKHLYAAAPRLCPDRVVIASSLQRTELFERVGATLLRDEPRLTRVIEVPEDPGGSALDGAAEEAGRRVVFDGTESQENLRFHSGMLLIGKHPSQTVFRDSGGTLAVGVQRQRRKLWRELGWGETEPDRLILDIPGGPPLSRVHLIVSWDGPLRARVMPGHVESTRALVQGYGLLNDPEDEPVAPDTMEIRLIDIRQPHETNSYLLQLQVRDGALRVTVATRRLSESESFQARAPEQADPEAVSQEQDELLDVLDTAVFVQSASATFPPCFDAWEARRRNLPHWFRRMQANTEPTQTFKRMLKKHARESAAFQEKVCTLMEKGERLGGSASKHAESVRNWLQRQDLREVS